MSQSHVGVPHVSIGVPVYNGARYLEEALTALRDQDLAEIEVIVSDNGSTDETPEIARRFAAEDPRFRLVRSETNRGLPWNFNRALDLARAPLFMWNAADDVVSPQHLVRCRDALRDNPDAAIAFPRVTLIDAEGAVVGHMDDDGLQFLGLSPSERVDLLLRREAYQAIAWGGVLRTDLLREWGGHPPFFGGDIVLGIRSAMRQPWVVVPERLFSSRRHDTQNSKAIGADVIDQVRSYDPSYSRPVAFPQWYLTGRMLWEVVAAPAPWGERLRATSSVVRRWTLPNWRLLPYDVKRNAIHLTRGRYEGAYSAASGYWV